MEVAMRKLFVVGLTAAAAAFVVIGVGAAGGQGTAHSAKATLSLKASASGALKFNKKKLSASRGTVTIVMTNPSSSGVKHGVAVEGKGVDKDGAIVKPGRKSTLTVRLKKPGKYEFYCPFDGHKNAGMKGTLTIH
jgi:plastocyanin